MRVTDIILENTYNTMFKYIAHYKPNQVICGFGQTVVVTGWMVKGTVAKKLEPHTYAAIGQLYSPTRGISFLVRNLLANPHVTSLVILNATREDKNAGACSCLADFFRYGATEGVSDTGVKCWVINSPITGYIDIEVSEGALNLLRESVKWCEVGSIAEMIEKVQTLFPTITPVTREALIFPLIQNLPIVLPGNLYGHRIEGRTIAETWVKIIHRIKTTGVIRPTGYDGQWQELIDLMAVITDEPKDFYFPEPNYLPCDRDFITEYIPQILEDAPIREGVKYTYGQRLRSWFGRDQIEQVIAKLIGEIDAASAVMSIWDTQDHEKGGSPCLNHIWLRVVDGVLSLTATFRSNDMYMAWVSNAMGLRALQRYIRDEIANRSSYNLTMGALITISQSAHIYDDTWENADMLIKNHYGKGKQLFNDSVGNFLIETSDNKITISQTTPGSGEIVATYSGTSPLKLIREIASANPAITPDHIGYLGIELQKALDNSGYIQDS